MYSKNLLFYQKEYPNIHYHLFSGNSEDVLEKLDKGLIDFGFLVDPSDIKEYNYIKLPLFDTWGLLIRKDNPLSKKKYITSKDILDIPLLCSRQAMENNELTGYLEVDIEKLNIIATYNLIYNAALLVKQGLGSAITLDKLVDVSDNAKLCFRNFFPTLKANLVLVWKKYQIFSKPAQKFLDEIKNTFNILN